MRVPYLKVQGSFEGTLGSLDDPWFPCEVFLEDLCEVGRAELMLKLLYFVLVLANLGILSFENGDADVSESRDPLDLEVGLRHGASNVQGLLMAGVNNPTDDTVEDDDERIGGLARPSQHITEGSHIGPSDCKFRIL